jgi:hypothetical protein
VVIRAGRSDVSTVENSLDALDNVDVVTGVAAIRDQGPVFSGVLRTLAICEADFARLRGSGGRVLPPMLPRVQPLPRKWPKLARGRRDGWQTTREHVNLVARRACQPLSGDITPVHNPPSRASATP